MSIHYNPRYTSISDIRGPSGWYTIWLNEEPVTVYVDQTYSGGGWVCVLANRINTSGMNNLTYYNAVNTCNYRTGSVANSTNTLVTVPSKLGSLSDYNIFIGARLWPLLGYRANASAITVVQFVSTSVQPLSGTHTKRYRWQFSNWSTTYGFAGVSAVSDETGTGAPGMYNYHALNGFGLTTYDFDQDQNGGNCATYYNNNPFWYGSCWSGNWFAGGGYADAPYWDSSGSDYHNYGAVYIK